MPAFTATAPGKIILFGEHAVVYGQPAIAVPLFSSRARASIHPQIHGNQGEIWIDAPQLSLSASLYDLVQDHPIRVALQLAAGKNNISEAPACKVLIDSEIPVSSGLGSSAAVSTALIRAFSGFLGTRLTDQEISDLVYEVEKIEHGTPSGIDNTVVAFQHPVYYKKGSPIDFLPIPKPFKLVIADCGIAGETRLAVQGVRDRLEADPVRTQKIVTEIGEISQSARELILDGKPEDLGELMDHNHTLLQELGVSISKLDDLVQAAREAGALGAKLSGGGLGGHIIALVNEREEEILQKLLERGAIRAETTSI